MLIIKTFAHSILLIYFPGTNFIDIEFTQWRIFFSVKPSPVNTCPRCPPQRAQAISVRMPSASKLLCTAPGISSSKLGQPQVELNLSFELYKGASHCLQTYTPVSLLFTYSPVKGASVPLSRITLFSSGVSSFIFILFPLDSSRRLGSNIVYNSINSLYFVSNTT